MVFPGTTGSTINSPGLNGKLSFSTVSAGNTRSSMPRKGTTSSPHLYGKTFPNWTGGTFSVKERSISSSSGLNNNTSRFTGLDSNPASFLTSNSRTDTSLAAANKTDRAAYENTASFLTLNAESASFLAVDNYTTTDHGQHSYTTSSPDTQRPRYSTEVNFLGQNAGNASAMLDEIGSEQYYRTDTTYTIKVCEMYSGLNDITIFLTIVGVLSNVFAMVALRRKNLGQNSACSYMTAYAMSTVFALTFLSGLDAVYCLLDQNHIRVVVGWVCMLWSFVAKIVVNSRIWFLLTLSVDRLLYVRFPYMASVYCTVFTARVIVLIVDIGLVVTSVHAMWFYQDAPQGCVIDYTDLFVDFWTWSSNIIYFYLPFFLLLGVTTCLSVSLVVTRHPQICSNRPHSRPPSIRFQAVDEFAVTSVVTSLCFILLSAPKQAIDAVNLNFPSLWLYAGLNDQIAVVGKIAETLYVADHTLFGLIYVLCSKAVRREKFLRGRSNGHVHYIAANDVGVFQPEEATVNTAF